MICSQHDPDSLTQGRVLVLPRLCHQSEVHVVRLIAPLQSDLPAQELSAVGQRVLLGRQRCGLTQVIATVCSLSVLVIRSLGGGGWSVSVRPPLGVLT